MAQHEKHSAYQLVIMMIQNDIQLGTLTFCQIAAKYGIGYEEVDFIWQEMVDNMDCGDRDDDADYKQDFYATDWD